MKKLTKLMLFLAHMGMVGAVQAASVSLSPTSQTVTHPNPGSVSFNVDVDFSGIDEATFGGRFQLSYDASILGFTSFNYNSSFTSSLMTYTPTLSSGLINGLGFAAAGLDPFTGSGTLGTVTFSTLKVGSAKLATAAHLNSDFWFRNSDFSSILDVDYRGATVSAVPVPATLWLMASGLGALGLGLRRRRA